MKIIISERIFLLKIQEFVYQLARINILKLSKISEKNFLKREKRKKWQIELFSKKNF